MIEIVKGPKLIRQRGAKYFRECAHCGTKVWLTYEDASRNAKRSNYFFCSSRCSASFRREIGNDMVADAIAMRLDGETWTFIAKSHGYTMQALQARIWMRLHEKGMLKLPAVRAIWSPQQAKWVGRQASWGWLEKKTGLNLTDGQGMKESNHAE